MDSDVKIKMQFFSDDEKQNVMDSFERIVFSKGRMELFFIKIDEIGEKERLAVRSAVNGGQQVILFSKNNDVAALAWKADVAYYVDMNDSTMDMSLQNGLKRANMRINDAENHKVAFNSQSQVNMVDATKILFVAAAGNYCDIHLQDGAVVTVTKQLGKMCDILSPYPNMKRVGKSLIVNINKVTSLKGCEVAFGGREKLKFDANSRCIGQLRKFLLWN